MAHDFARMYWVIYYIEFLGKAGLHDEGDKNWYLFLSFYHYYYYHIKIKQSGKYDFVFYLSSIF